jgi:arylsulfatase A-like enzyme
MYRPEEIELAPNVPETHAEIAREQLAGYYAHCTALDDCVGDLLDTLDEEGIADDTIFLFFSDHGDMIGAHGMDKKQKPWEESIRIPFLFRYPGLLGRGGKEVDALIDLPDVMPTLLSLCDIPIPDSVEGLDYSAYLQGGEDPSDGSALLTCPHPFGQWWPGLGGRAYRGLRTQRYTYARVLEGPWLLYDNREDPYQQTNLIGKKEHRDLLYELDAWLQRRLDASGDEFLPSVDYIRRWGYKVDERGTVPYTL